MAFRITTQPRTRESGGQCPGYATGCGSTIATRDFGVPLVSNSATAISLHYGRWKIASMLPFRAGNADLSCHLLTLELELQDALVALKNVRLLGDSRAGVPHFLLSAAVAGFGDKTFVFVRTQDAAGIILQSIRSELREVRYGECVSHIMSRVDTLQINHANSRRFV